MTNGNRRNRKTPNRKQNRNRIEIKIKKTETQNVLSMKFAGVFVRGGRYVRKGEEGS